MKKNVILFIPGYKGSFLKDPQTQKRVWLSMGGILSNQKALSIPHYPKLEPDGALDCLRLGPIPLRTFYTPFFNKLKTLPSYDFSCLSYDWRQDLFTHVSALHRALIELKQKYQHVIVVGHSLGGYFLSYYLRFDTQRPAKAKENWLGLNLIDGLIFAGVPFRGTLTAFRDACLGETIGLDTELLNTQATRSFPIAYQLLPQWGDAIHLSDRSYVGLLNAEVWKRYGWSGFHPHFSTHFETGKTIAKLIHLPNQSMPKKIPMINFVGTERPTAQSLYWDTLSNTLELKRAILMSGDGTVTQNSSRLPEAFNEFSAETIELKGRKHIDLLTHPAVWPKLKTFIDHVG